LGKNGVRYNLPRYVTEIFSELLERRNEFWTSYGQLIIATLIIIVLTILLLTKTITAEAGLPILSAISGFAIAKGVASGRSSSGGPGTKVNMKVSEILSLLAKDDWYLVATRGSHRQFRHPTKSGRVTVPGKPSDDVAPGTLNSILKQAQLKR